MDRKSVVLLSACLSFSVAGWGQGLSTINGSVTDPTGAAVPGAKVLLTETETRLARSTVTTSDGFYVLSALRPTRYALVVEAAGFRSLTQTGITLQVNETATINFKLELGATSEIINVEANASQVDTATSTLREVVDSRRVVDLPLNGRNLAQLTTLVAGSVQAVNYGADSGITKTFPVAVPISTNGTRSNQTSYYLDGVPNIDILTNINLPFPMPDATQEFSVQTTNYDAEYGQNAGAVVNIVSRSGTNELHGSAFGYVRNKVFNARDFFAAQRDPLKRSQFGATVGGPVIRDKAFFFFGYQGTRIRTETGGLSAFVPTEANLTGDFSSLLSATNPNNPQGRAILLRDPTSPTILFPGNQVPVTRFDRASVTMARDWLPRATGSGLVFYSRPGNQNVDEYTGKVDYNLSNNDRAMVRYFKDNFDAPAPLKEGNILTYQDWVQFGVTNVAITETHIFGPKLLNDFRFGFMYESNVRYAPPNSPSVADFGVNIWQAPRKAIDSSLSVSGYFSCGSFPYGTFPRAGFTWGDTLRYSSGRHSFSAGGTYERDRLNEYTDTNANGTFSFSGDATGSALPDFMMGRLRTFVQGNGYVQANRYNLFSLFVLDTFKVTARLALNYGLRWEPSFPWDDKYHEAMAFFPDRYSQGVTSQVYKNAPPGQMFPGDPGVPPNGRRKDWYNLSPRLGFAYDVFGGGKTSIRGGVGMFFDSRVPGFANNRQAQATPFTLAVTLTSPVGSFSDPYLGITNPFPAPLPPPKDVVFPKPVLVYSWSPLDRISPKRYTWNLTVEQEVPGNWALRIAYVGSRSTHSNVNVNMNPSVYIPGSTLSTDSRRIFQGFGAIRLASSSGNSWYNAMQATIRKRLSRGFSLSASYTWSKSLDDVSAGGADFVTPAVGADYTLPWTVKDYKHYDRGPAASDYAHVLSGSFVWSLPVLNHRSAFLRGAAGGWQFNGIVQARTGGAFTVRSGLDRSLSGVGQDRAVMLSDDIYRSGACANLAPCVNYLNPAAFGQPELGTFGSLGKGVFRGPGRSSVNLTMSKQFPLREQVSLQFRAEFFNALNHTGFADPGTTLSAAGFGTIRSTAVEPRIGQLALRLTF